MPHLDAVDGRVVHPDAETLQRLQIEALNADDQRALADRIFACLRLLENGQATDADKSLARHALGRLSHESQARAGRFRRELQAWGQGRHNMIFANRPWGSEDHCDWRGLVNLAKRKFARRSTPRQRAKRSSGVRRRGSRRCISSRGSPDDDPHPTRRPSCWGWS